MGLYWRRSTKILPGVRINWSKSGPSLSVGPKGAKVNVGRRGTYVSGGIPGTGLYYRQKVGGGSRKSGSTPFTTNPTFGFSKNGCLVSVAIIVILSLLFSGNFITAALVAAVSSACWFVMAKKDKTQPDSTTNSGNTTPNQSANSDSTPPSQPSTLTNDIDVRVAVAEVEHLIAEIDKSSDKIKLPAIYRKLMSIVYKLEKIDNVEIQGLPIEEAKRRILENYRKKMA